MGEGTIKILEGLSGPLRTELASELHLAAIQTHPFFRNLGKDLRFASLRVGARALTEISFAKKDVVFRRGDEACYAYFVSRGSFNYVLADPNGGDLVQPLH